MNNKIVWTLGIISITALLGLNLYGGRSLSAQNLDFSRMNDPIYGFFNQDNLNQKSNKLSIDELKTKVYHYIDRIDENLEIADIFVYDNADYYFSIEEQGTGKGAMELLVNPYTGEIYPEYGPNMMWNEKYDTIDGNFGSGMMGSNYGHGSAMMGGNYGHMSGMMGGRYSGDRNFNMMDGYYNNPDYTITNLSRLEALDIANDFVQSQFNDDLIVTNEGHAFYGYYTFHIEEAGHVVGMLSVNEDTGDVWYHNWHGTIVEIISHHEDEHTMK